MKLSVITVCRNEEATIAATAESVCNQSFADFEWFVLDGLSSDHTVSALKPFMTKITSFSSEPDRGRYNAMNKGARLAHGEYLLFLNGGDMLADSRVFEECFATYWKADILVGDLIVCRQNGTRKILKCTEDMLNPQHLWTASFPHPSTFIRRDLFNKLGGYDESFQIAADYELFARAILKSGASVQLLRQVISIFMTGGISTSESTKEIRDKESKRVRQCYISKWDLMKAYISKLKMWPWCHSKLHI